MPPISPFAGGLTSHCGPRQRFPRLSRGGEGGWNRDVTAGDMSTFSIRIATPPNQVAGPTTRGRWCFCRRSVSECSGAVPGDGLAVGSRPPVEPPWATVGRVLVPTIRKGFAKTFVSGLDRRFGTSHLPRGPITDGLLGCSPIHPHLPPLPWGPSTPGSLSRLRRMTGRSPSPPCRALDFFWAKILLG